MFLYDFALTFADEWTLIWAPLVSMPRFQRSGSAFGRLKVLNTLPRPTLLYLLARYSMTVIGILYLSGECGGLCAS